MPLRYTYVFDTAYCRTVISRYYRQRPVYLRLHFQFAVVVMLVVLAWAYTRSATDRSMPALLITLCFSGVLIVGFTFLVRFSIMMKLRKSREFGKEVTITLSDRGLEASGSNGRSSVKWNAYPRSVRYSDGILLTRGGAIRWLPNAALEEGSLEEVLALVRAKTTLRTIS